MLHYWGGRETFHFDPDLHPEYTSLYSPEPARFRIPAASLADLPYPYENTGSDTLDRLIRAADFNTRGLALDALEALEGFPENASPGERDMARFLQAEAYALLGDSESFERVRRSLSD